MRASSASGDRATGGAAIGCARSFQVRLQALLQEAGLSLNLAKSAIVPFSAPAPKGVVSFLGFDFYRGRNKSGGRLLKLKTAAKRLHRSLQAFTEWVKATRNKKPLTQPQGDELIDFDSEHRAVRMHQPKSRMREIRTSGSVRSLSRSIGRLRSTR
jgi:hypothetical protein